MRLPILFRQSWKSIRSRPSRSLLTVLGIVIGVAGVIIIISLGAGAQALIVGQVTKLGSNLISVSPGKSDESGPPAAVFGVEITTLTLDDVFALRAELANVVAVDPIINTQQTVVASKKSIDTTVVGALSEYTTIRDVVPEKGVFFSTTQAEAGDSVAVLGYDTARSLFPEENPIGKVIKVKNVPLRVIGVMGKRGTAFFQNEDDRVYVPIKIVQQQLLGIRHIQALAIKVTSAEYLKVVMRDTKEILRRQHKIHSENEEDFSVRDLADAVKILTGITDALRLFLVVMAGVSLLVGGIGIMNIMLVTVSERTREIGLRKALGATPNDIRTQFLVEAVAITSVGGVLGIFVGTVISFLIAQGARFAGFDWAFIISPFAILLALLVSVATGIIFGLAPARKAANLDPIEALRYE